jgi:hypothetical protein
MVSSSARMPSFKKEETEQDSLGSYEWVKGHEQIIKYYPKHRRYGCVHAQKRHGLIAGTCVFCAQNV